MFYDKFAYLCKQRGVSVSRGALEAGISKSLVTKWKNNSIEIPSADVIAKLAKYFNISVAELLDEETKEAPALTQRDERDIAKDLESIMANLESADGLMFDGNPMSDEARESMRAAIELGLRTVKVLNKETYTPKKHKKG